MSRLWENVDVLGSGFLLGFALGALYRALAQRYVDRRAPEGSDRNA